MTNRANTGEIRFYDDEHSALSDRPGTGFCQMHYRRTVSRGRSSADEMLNCLCEPAGAWSVDDWLVDSQGKYWSRLWLGIVDDFGDLIEIDPDIGDDIPF